LIGGLRCLREIVMRSQPGGVFAESSSPDAALQILLTSFNVSKEISRSVKCRSSNAWESSVKTNSTVKVPDWNISFWFAASSPLLGVLLGFGAVAIFYRW